MKKEIDCQVFEEQLDALMEGSLPSEGLGQLQIHALTCTDCAMLLRVQEHLALPSLEELEALVPEDLLGSVWTNVADVAKEGGTGALAGVSAEPSVQDGGPADGAIVGTRETFGEETGGRSVSPISPAHETPGGGQGEKLGSRKLPLLLPTLAAASVALLLSTGFLFSELRRTQARGLQLAEEVEDLREEMTDFDTRTEWIERTAELAGTRRARALDDAMGGLEAVTLGALIERLGDYPANMVLFEASQIDGFLGESIRPPPELRELLNILADEIRASGENQGVRAGDLAQWIANSGLPAEMVLPKSQLMELLS